MLAKLRQCLITISSPSCRSYQMSHRKRGVQNKKTATRLSSLLSRPADHSSMSSHGSTQHVPALKRHAEIE